MIQNENRLDALGDRRQNTRLTLADRLYTATVKKLRWLLPATAIAIVVALMLWPKIAAEFSSRRFEPSPIDAATLEKAATENRLANARFSSTDAKGRPFSIVATEARQDTKNPDNIALTAPDGTLQISDTVSMTAQSATGTYHQADQILDLSGGVTLTRSDGTVMKANTLNVNLMTNDAVTGDAVAIDGPDGKLNAANGMTTTGGGATTIFKGPAKLTLYPKNSINPKGDAR